MKGKPKLHILFEYQLNTYLTVDSVVFKKFGGQIPKFACANFGICPPKFFEDLSIELIFIENV